jgi:hypothetical protein
MGPVPHEIGGAQVLCFTPIDERHRFTGKCRHIVAGVLQGPAAGLAICRYPHTVGYYLFGCNAGWECITDTWHETVEAARAQAESEYVGVSATWQERPGLLK